VTKIAHCYLGNPENGWHLSRNLHSPASLHNGMIRLEHSRDLDSYTMYKITTIK
jgi:hypothetical protein